MPVKCKPILGNPKGRFIKNKRIREKVKKEALKGGILKGRI